MNAFICEHAHAPSLKKAQFFGCRLQIITNVNEQNLGGQLLTCTFQSRLEIHNVFGLSREHSEIHAYSELDSVCLV